MHTLVVQTTDCRKDGLCYTCANAGEGGWGRRARCVLCATFLTYNVASSSAARSPKPHGYKRSGSALSASSDAIPWRRVRGNMRDAQQLDSIRTTGAWQKGKASRWLRALVSYAGSAAAP